MDDKEKKRQETLNKFRENDKSEASKIIDGIISRPKNKVDIDTDKVLSGSANTINSALKDGGSFFKWLFVGVVLVVLIVIFLVLKGVLK